VKQQTQKPGVKEKVRGSVRSVTSRLKSERVQHTVRVRLTRSIKSGGETVRITQTTEMVVTEPATDNN